MSELVRLIKPAFILRFFADVSSYLSPTYLKLKQLLQHREYMYRAQERCDTLMDIATRNNRARDMRNQLVLAILGDACADMIRWFMQKYWSQGEKLTIWSVEKMIWKNQQLLSGQEVIDMLRLFDSMDCMHHDDEDARVLYLRHAMMRDDRFEVFEKYFMEGDKAELYTSMLDPGPLLWNQLVCRETVSPKFFAYLVRTRNKEILDDPNWQPHVSRFGPDLVCDIADEDGGLDLRKRYMQSHQVPKTLNEEQVERLTRDIPVSEIPWHFICAYVHSPMIQRRILEAATPLSHAHAVNIVVEAIHVLHASDFLFQVLEKHGQSLRPCDRVWEDLAIAERVPIQARIAALQRAMDAGYIHGSDVVDAEFFDLCTWEEVALDLAPLLPSLTWDMMMDMLRMWHSDPDHFHACVLEKYGLRPYLCPSHDNLEMAVKITTWSESVATEYTSMFVSQRSAEITRGMYKHPDVKKIVRQTVWEHFIVNKTVVPYALRAEELGRLGWSGLSRFSPALSIFETACLESLDFILSTPEYNLNDDATIHAIMSDYWTWSRFLEYLTSCPEERFRIFEQHAPKFVRTLFQNEDCIYETWVEAQQEGVDLLRIFGPQTIAHFESILRLVAGAEDKSLQRVFVIGVWRVEVQKGTNFDMINYMIHNFRECCERDRDNDCFDYQVADNVTAYLATTHDFFLMMVPPEDR